MCGTFWYQRKGLDRMKGKKAVIATDPAESGQLEPSVRERVLKAGFAEFCKRGFSGATTLEIASRQGLEARPVRAVPQQTRDAGCVHQGARHPHALAARSLEAPGDGIIFDGPHQSFHLDPALTASLS
jgi:hypothetical protein